MARPPKVTPAEEVRGTDEFLGSRSFANDHATQAVWMYCAITKQPTAPVTVTVMPDIILAEANVKMRRYSGSVFRKNLWPR